MKPTPGFPVLLKTALTLAVVFLFSGCAGPVPPVFSLYGYQRLAIIPFDNNTHDPALAGDLQDEMASEIVNLNAVPVIEAGLVAAYLKSIVAKATDVPTDPGLRQQIAQNFKCDLLLLGTADGYTEFLKDEAPQRSDLGWGFYTDRKVVIINSAKLMDPASGGILWFRNKNWGASWHNTWNPLPVPQTVVLPGLLGQFVDLANLVIDRVDHKEDVEPPAVDETYTGSPIYPQSRAFARQRQKAIVATVNSLVDNFQGHYNWTPGLKTGNGQ